MAASSTGEAQAKLGSNLILALSGNFCGEVSGCVDITGANVLWYILRIIKQLVPSLIVC